MPKNKVIYLGMLVVAAAALLWAGGKIINQIDWFLPYAGGVGVVMILVGIFLESRKKTVETPVGPPKSP